MKITSKSDGRAYINVIFGNFYCPGYDDENFVDEIMELIHSLGFNSVMLDTKASEDFLESYETGQKSQYVKMQEYMQKSAREHGLSYNYLLLYLNGDNLYPHIRFSPPIYGEETVAYDGKPGKWYKYWSPKARISMQEHVERIMEQYKAGCVRCLIEGESTREIIPVCSMWDPIVAPSFDTEGKRHYQEYLRERYDGNIEKVNKLYEIEADSFEALTPEQYWYEVRYGETTFFKEQDVKEMTPCFCVWRDNALWKMQELKLYFSDMEKCLKEKNPELFLCPDMTQWGYFLNIYGRKQQDHDNDYSPLWDTAMRGIDIYGLAPYVDSCHFITVPVTPDGLPDAYVVSCQHSMMRVMNEKKAKIGGIYWGRYIYGDIYAFLSPAELIATMAACGMDGYTCYGMNGLDDGGVLNRMKSDFLELLQLGNDWFAKVCSLRMGERKKEIAILFPSEMAHLEPFEVGNNKIRRLDLLGWYHMCCDLGFQVDVISEYQINQGKLENYKMLVVPSNDCYQAVPHEKMEEIIVQWVKQGGVLLHGPKDKLAENCFAIYGEDCPKQPYQYDKTIIPQGSAFCNYTHGVSVADYAGSKGCCVAKKEEADWKGAVYSFGVEIGASYAAKNIPHVPYVHGNKEMYPIIQSNTALFADIFYHYLKPQSDIRERGIETGVFSNGMVIVNHRSTPYVLPNRYRVECYQYQAGKSEEGMGILMPHTAVWVADN